MIGRLKLPFSPVTVEPTSLPPSEIVTGWPAWNWLPVTSTVAGWLASGIADGVSVICGHSTVICAAAEITCSLNVWSSTTWCVPQDGEPVKSRPPPAVVVNPCGPVDREGEAAGQREVLRRHLEGGGQLLIAHDVRADRDARAADVDRRRAHQGAGAAVHFCRHGHGVHAAQRLGQCAYPAGRREWERLAECAGVPVHLRVADGDGVESHVDETVVVRADRSAHGGPG